MTKTQAIQEEPTLNYSYFIVPPHILKGIQNQISNEDIKSNIHEALKNAREISVNKDGEEVYYKMSIKINNPELLAKFLTELITNDPATEISSITKKTAKKVITTKLEKRIEKDAEKTYYLTLPALISIIRKVDTTLTLTKMAEISGITESTLKRWKINQPKTKPTSLGNESNNKALQNLILHVITNEDETVNLKHLKKLVKQLQKHLKKNEFEKIFAHYKNATTPNEAQLLANDIVENLKDSFAE